MSLIMISQIFAFHVFVFVLLLKLIIKGYLLCKLPNLHFYRATRVALDDSQNSIIFILGLSHTDPETCCQLPGNPRSLGKMCHPWIHGESVVEAPKRFLHQKSSSDCFGFSRLSCSPVVCEGRCWHVYKHLSTAHPAEVKAHCACWLLQ